MCRAKNDHNGGGWSSSYPLQDGRLAPANIAKYFIGPCGATKGSTKHLYIVYDRAVALVVDKVGCKAVLLQDGLERWLEQNVGDDEVGV